MYESGNAKKEMNKMKTGHAEIMAILKELDEDLAAHAQSEKKEVIDGNASQEGYGLLLYEKGYCP